MRGATGAIRRSSDHRRRDARKSRRELVLSPDAATPSAHALPSSQGPETVGPGVPHGLALEKPFTLDAPVERVAGALNQ